MCQLDFTLEFISSLSSVVFILENLYKRSSQTALQYLLSFTHVSVLIALHSWNVSRFCAYSIFKYCLKKPRIRWRLRFDVVLLN